MDKCAAILSLLGESALTGAEICSRLGMSTSTGYRILHSLAQHEFVVRRSDGAFCLGPFPAGRRENDVQTVLTELRNVTGESVQLWLLDGDRRVCVITVESMNELRISKSAGTALLLADGGSAALALTGSVDGQTVYVTTEARRAGIGSASVGFEPMTSARLAVCVSFPLTRMPRSVESSYGPHLRRAAQTLQRSLREGDALLVLSEVARVAHLES
ncbi:helix-turn-helix domain-containing protein [Brevibacterium daeguense]|uniref:helix-turn-helix domain-containing protein n=1 Tax=Brevibacterium daeguense TaxID=909936 RepID=UPI0030165207